MHEVQVDVDQAVGDLVGLPDLVEQGLRHQLRRSPAATTARNSAGVVAVVDEVVRQVGVEGDAVARAQLVALVVDHQRRARPARTTARLAAARLVQRRVAGAAGGGARLERVQRDVGALPGKRRGQLLGRGGRAPLRHAALGRGA